MNDFLYFINNLRKQFPIHLGIYYNKTADWCITVYKKGCAKDYPESANSGDDAILCDVQDSDMELAFARAHVEVKKWLMDNNGGY